MFEILFLLGSAASVGSSLMAGGAKSASAEFEADQMRIQGEMSRIAADQAEAARREELTSSLQNIAAIQAGRGVRLTDPTSLAINAGIVERGERDVRAERLNFLQSADLAERGALLKDREAKMSITTGVLGGLATAGAAAGRYRSIAGGY